MSRIGPGRHIHTMGELRAAINESVRGMIDPVFFGKNDVGVTVGISKADALVLVAFSDHNLHPDSMTIQDLRDTSFESFGYLADNGDLYINLV